MKFDKRPSFERIVQEPEIIYAEGKHIRFHSKGDDMFVSFTRATPGSLGYQFTRDSLLQMIEEFKEVGEKLSES